MDNTIVSPTEYFEQVKSRKQTMTAAGLSQLYENCLALLEEYQRSGQAAFPHRQYHTRKEAA